MIKKFKIGDIKIDLIFKHKWGNKNSLRNRMDFKDYSLGIWFRLDKLVGRKNANQVKNWEKNLVNEYTFGVNLILCKLYICFSKGAL